MIVKTRDGRPKRSANCLEFIFHCCIGGDIGMINFCKVSVIISRHLAANDCRICLLGPLIFVEQCFKRCEKTNTLLAHSCIETWFLYEFHILLQHNTKCSVIKYGTPYPGFNFSCRIVCDSLPFDY